MEEENEEDSFTVEEVEDFEDEDAISSPMSSLIPSITPSTGFDLASLLEDVVTDSSSMNSEIISATAEDFSEIGSGISAKELGSVVETLCSSFDAC